MCYVICNVKHYNLTIYNTGARTGNAVLQWCQVDTSADAIYPQWEVHLPCIQCGHSALPSADILVVAVGSDVLMYGAQGLLRVLQPRNLYPDTIAGVAAWTTNGSCEATIITSRYNGVYMKHTVQLEGSSPGTVLTTEQLAPRAGASVCGLLCEQRTNPRHCEACSLVKRDFHFESFLPYFHSMLVIGPTGDARQRGCTERRGVLGLAVHRTFGHDILYLEEPIGTCYLSNKYDTMIRTCA